MRDVDARIVKALAHPLRVQILQAFEARTTASAVELSDDLGVDLGVMSYHVRRLHELGLLDLVRRVQRRGAIQTYYSLNLLACKPSDATKPRVPGRLLAAFARNLAREAHLSLEAGGFDHLLTVLAYKVAKLDATGREELAAAIHQWSARIEAISAEARSRDAHQSEATHRIVAGLLLSDFAPEELAGPAKRRWSPRV